MVAVHTLFPKLVIGFPGQLPKLVHDPNTNTGVESGLETWNVTFCTCANKVQVVKNPTAKSKSFLYIVCSFCVSLKVVSEGCVMEIFYYDFMLKAVVGCLAIEEPQV